LSNEAPKKVDPQYPSGGGVLGVGHDAAIGTLGAAASFVIPLTGPVVQALLKKCVQAPLEVRRAAWFNLVGEGLRELQDRFEGFDPDRLAENEEFVSTVAETTRLAMATHRAEKLEALRNIVLNAAVGLTLDEVSHGTFMSLVERFSVLHLRMMQVLNAPLETPEILAIGGVEAMMPMTDALVAAFRERADRAVVGTVLTDLQSAHLMRDLNSAVISPDPLTSRCLTPLGESFVRFISSPLV
jgi:3-methyladenine DNA glycosylase Tag